MFPGMYTVTVGQKKFKDLTFGDAMRKIESSFEVDKKAKASIERQK